MGERVDTLDELTVEMDELSFELRIVMSRYISEVLSRQEGRLLTLDLYFPCIEEESCVMGKGRAIGLDPESGTIIISLEGGTSMAWDDLSVTGQDVIVRQVHHEMVTRRFIGKGASEGIH